MYVTPTTTKQQIEDEIEVIEDELHRSRGMSEIDRIAMYDELDYLKSFLSEERW